MQFRLQSDKNKSVVKLVGENIHKQAINSDGCELCRSDSQSTGLSYSLHKPVASFPQNNPQFVLIIMLRFPI